MGRPYSLSSYRWFKGIRDMNEKSPFTLIYQSYDLPGESTTSVTGSDSTGGATTVEDLPPAGEATIDSGLAEHTDTAAATAMEATLDAQIATIEEAAPELVESINALNSNLRRALLTNSFAQTSSGDGTVAARMLAPVVEDLGRNKQVQTVALWDVNAWVTHLARVIEPLNYAQPLFTFFDYHIPLPVGLISPPERVIAWVRAALNHQNKRLTKKAREEIEYGNIIFNDFYENAKAVYEDLGVDFLVGITQSMIAGQRPGKPPFYNHYSTSQDKTLLISAYKLREYANEAGRPFEVAVASLVIGELLVDINKNRELIYHTPDTGCLFDFNEKNENIIYSLKDLKIEDRCLGLIDEEYRDAAASMIEVLRSYTNEEEEEKPKPAQEEDNAYWLEKLRALAEGETA
jgi:hypothetical protein